MHDDTQIPPELQTESITPPSEDVRPLPNPPEQRLPKAGVSLFTCAVVSMAFAAFAGFSSYQLAIRDHQTTAPVVLVNGSRLAEAQMAATTAKANVSPEQAQADGLAFVEGLKTALKPYTDAGIVVVNSSVVLNAPDGLDITKQVAQQLGLEAN